MPVDHIRYDLLTQKALREVVRMVLSDVAKNGLPGEHHFFVTFDTRADGVRLSQRMRAQYPEEITIVLQHQFWDLTVGEDAFEVGLSFGGVPERLVVPFAAVNRFRDPSVQFEVQFRLIEEIPESASPASPPRSKGQAEPAGAPRRPVAAPVPTSADPAPADDQAKRPGEPPGQGGEVVSLDRFRKK
jgi:uncharacterized protein